MTRRFCASLLFQHKSAYFFLEAAGSGALAASFIARVRALERKAFFSVAERKLGLTVPG